MSERDPIDFVITWVDGSDPAWQAQKAQYSAPKKAAAPKGDSRNTRYRDWDNLQYWFRAVEKFAPWVNRIHFVTWGHLPKWLNTEHPKLNIVKHTDYIPEEYLPTFSSRPIDMNLHRIPGIAEHFVYFNDDMFLTQPVKPEDFFLNGLPRDSAIQQPIRFDRPGVKKGDKAKKVTNYMAPAYNMIVINFHFDKRQVMKQHRDKWFARCYGKGNLKNWMLNQWSYFPGFVNCHIPYSYCKATYEEVWDKEFDTLNQACIHKFRQESDVNHQVFSYWQMASGNFAPRSPHIGRQFFLTSDEKRNQALYDALNRQTYKMICMNDDVYGENFEQVMEHVNRCFAALLPDKSGFER